VLVVLLVALLLPAVMPNPPAPRKASARDASTPSALGGILLVCAIILLVVIGQTTYGTYSVVWLGEVAAIPSAAIPAFLFGTGLAAFVAVSAVGRIADRFPNGAMPVAVGLLAVLSALFPLAAAWGIGALVVTALLQAMAFAVVPILLQTRMMRIAPPHQRATAAALQTTAFNVAIGGGAALGALVVGAWGLGALPWVAAVLPVGGTDPAAPHAPSLDIARRYRPTPVPEPHGGSQCLLSQPTSTPRSAPRSVPTASSPR
jgi:predicted MFS family arabinose efflux permease